SFRIDGGLHLSVFPGIKAVVEKASLANASGGKAANMAEIGKLIVGLKLWPLLSRHFAVQHFELDAAVIHLEVLPNGTPNWKFDTIKPPAAGADGNGKPNSQLKELSVGEVKIVNGLITYDDLKTGKSYEISRITASTGLKSLDSPVKFAGK